MINKKDTYANIIFGILGQITVILCGLIVPKLILNYYGSETNGTIASITQFLSFITLLESGVGGVSKVAFYKPLSNKNKNQISNVYYSVSSFFIKIGLIFIPYILLIAFIYPFAVKTIFTFNFLFPLVLIIGISLTTKYFFGLPNQILLQADNKTYIVSIFEIAAIILNALLTFLCIKLSFNVHLLKIVTGSIFIIKPICLFLYVKKYYSIKRSESTNKVEIQNKWNGLGQHIAYLIHSNTDIIIISIFLGALFSSVYSVYFMVISGIECLINAIITSLNATFGILYAKNDFDKLKRVFCKTIKFSYFLIFFLLGATFFLIIPFVKNYTSGITDVNYVQPLFAFIFVVAETCYCLRIPLSSLALSCGFYKETTRDAFIEAALNIGVSILLVHFFGLVGVAIGTLVAMLYRYFAFLLFLRNSLLKIKISVCLKSIALNFVGIICSFAVTQRIKFNLSGWFNWVIGSCAFCLIILVNLFLFNLIDQDFLQQVSESFNNFFRKKKNVIK